MTTLQDFTKIAHNLKNSTTKAVKALHVIAFGDEGQPRMARRNLRNFRGFEIEENSAEYATKLTVVKEQSSTADLVSACHVLDLDYSGNNKEIIARICHFLVNLENAKETLVEHQSDNEEPEDEEADNRNEVGSIINSIKDMSFKPDPVPLSFRDVEDTIRQFDGKDGYPIEKWISDFEETAELTRWNDLQKLIYAKKSLRGIAKLFIQSEKGIKSWNTLKCLLIDEFQVKTSSAEIHKLLMSRRKKREESVQEYALVMREIASRAYIESEVVMQYIIDGIGDEPANKMILYGAKNFNEFKEKLKLYASMKSKSYRDFQPKKFSDTALSEKKKMSQNYMGNEDKSYSPYCYNCGEKGHKGRECPFKSKGVKCFKCRKFGHVASNCIAGKEIKTGSVEMITTSPRNYVPIVVKNLKIDALLDTGADVSVMRQDAYEEIGSPSLTTNQLILTGFGSQTIKTEGSFQSPVSIEDERFTIQFHVVPANSMKIKAILGNDVLAEADVHINAGKISVKKIVEEHELMQISLEENSKDQADLSNVVNNEFRKRIRSIIEKYQPEKTEETNVQMKIITKTDNPIFQHPRRLPFKERKEVEDQVEEWLDQGIIQPSCLEFASPVVVVRKKDQSARICVDYRKINKEIIKDRFPMPIIEDQLDQLQNARVFTTLDLKNGFFHVDVEDSSRKYTAFVTHNGQFEFRKVPFGLCNSPAVFQRYVKHVFRTLIRQGLVIVYVDEVIVPANDEEEALRRLECVFETARRYGLEFRWKKCQFLQRRVQFLGYVIENGTIQPSPEKFAAVRRFPKPTTIKQLQSFLGLTGYFRKFVSLYSIIAKPLTNILKTNVPFKFGVDEEQAFEKLKMIWCSNPVLRIYQRNARTELHTDASMEGFGAVLLQESDEDGQLHPVSYMSRKTTDAQKKYCSYELEVLAVIEALKKFRVYLLGSPFKIITDCAAFQKTISKKELATRVARWVLLLEEFDYEVVHRSGSRMQHVDALSRYPIMTITVDNLISRIQAAQNKDEHFKAIKKILENQTYEDYCVKIDILFKYNEDKEQLVVPRCMQSKVIKNAHENGHFAGKKTEEIVKREYYIPELSKKIQNIIGNCIPCILSNVKGGKKEGYLHPITKEESPLKTFHIDHLGPIPSTSKNYNHLLVIIDDFTKFVWIYPTKSTTSKETVKCLMHLQKMFGNPQRIISDRGTAFTAQEFKDFCTKEGIQHVLITTGVPRGNGQVERIHRIIIPIITKLCLSNPQEWYKHVDRVQRALNSTFQRAINTSPFELLVGVKMKTKQDLELVKHIEEETIKLFQENREELRIQSKEQLLKIQDENRRTYNLRRRKPTKYQVNDLVAIKRTQFGAGLKVQKKFLGPYQIIRSKGNDRYDVRKVGHHDGPGSTSTCAEFMKPWVNFAEESESDSTQDGRV